MALITSKWALKIPHLNSIKKDLNLLREEVRFTLVEIKA